MRLHLLYVALFGLIVIAGCGPKSNSNVTPVSSAVPKFTLAWSEYPSWSVFGVASEKGIIDGAAGKLGTMEKKWNVDIVLNQADYDPCLQQYGSSTTDAVCITNMDFLTLAKQRPGVAIMPTSTSDGADACVAVGIDSIDALKSIKTYGLEKSVSQYCFERVLELKGKKPADFPFAMMDPADAAKAMSSNVSTVQSIMVWNPFVMQTLRTRKDSKVLFDSSSIPEEIIDMVVVAKDAINKPGGQRFAYAVLETFYSMNRLLADPVEGDKTLVALGAKFSSLGLEDMKVVVKQTKFYKTPDEALVLLESDKFRTTTMPTVVDFCVSHGMSETKPIVGYSDPTAQMNIDLQYLTGIRKGIKPEEVK